jgi:RNA recognition motif-containing protein
VGNLDPQVSAARQNNLVQQRPKDLPKKMKANPRKPSRRVLTLPTPPTLVQVTEEVVWEIFVQAGPVVNVYVPKDRVSNAHQGYAFVEYRGEDDADYVSFGFDLIDRTPLFVFAPAPHAPFCFSPSVLRLSVVATSVVKGIRCLAMMRTYPRFRTASADEAQKYING